MSQFLLVSIYIIFAIITQSVSGGPCTGSAAAKRGAALQAYNQNVAENGKVQMTDTGTFPTLTGTICTTDKSNNKTATKWTLQIDSLAITVNNKKRPLCPGQTFKATGETFTMTPTQGGQATLSWEIGKKTGKMVFEIVGKNPTEAALLTAIGDNPWYAKYVATRESLLRQFETKGKKIDKPLISLDGGVGVFQLTNPRPTCDQVWKWPSNVAEGVKRLRNFNSRAETYMNQQRAIARNSTEAQVDVPVPKHEEANCLFEDGRTERTIKDAVAMKMFDGNSKGYFCAWDKAKKAWKFNTLNNRKENYVKNVCEKVPE